MSNTQTMVELAGYLNELGADGRIKGGGRAGRYPAQSGYAFISSMRRGCGIFLILENPESLIITLDITPFAERQDPELCSEVVSEFCKFFKGKIKEGQWEHPKGDRDLKSRYSVDVSNRPKKEIKALIDKLRAKFA